MIRHSYKGQLVDMAVVEAQAHRGATEKGGLMTTIIHYHPYEAPCSGDFQDSDHKVVKPGG